MRRNAYSLVEALIIVAFMTMVTVIVSPAVVHAWHGARTGQLHRYLEVLRSQTQRYQQEHGGRGPHLNERGELDAEGMIDRLTGSTYSSGKLSKLGPCGPYVHDWPANPFCHSSVAQAVKFGWALVPPRDGTAGWYYNLDTCIISSNSAGPEEYVAAASNSDFDGADYPGQKDLGLRLKGVFNGPDGMVAFINTERLRVGDKINGAKLVKVDWDSVVLQFDDGREVLHMAPRRGEGSDATISGLPAAKAPISAP